MIGQKLSTNFLFFHTKIENSLLLFTANTNILILLYRELKTDGKSFIFAVCRLPFAVNVILNLSNNKQLLDDVSVISASADNPYFDLDYSGYHKNRI